ncbi:MAG: 16S rRNA (cytosine(1402)-N(4))-methyltransferase [Anaerolinea sp.]|nr:16S rRNA (cytosine(1402)-N(4))-methyltransferase [Anaerolinea sp.]
MDQVLGTTPAPHLPVLYHEVLKTLNPVHSRHYVDGTLGAGGHARGLLEYSAPDGQLLGMDLDPAALKLASANLTQFSERCHLVQASYTEMQREVRLLGWKSVNGILLDLGISSMQVDNPARGFSFRSDAPLDMRFNPEVGVTAADLVNQSTEEELLQILWEYGEEQQARRIVRSILIARPLHTTGQLASLIEDAVGKSRRGIHPATRTFQALRIVVNNELENIKVVLPDAIQLLSPGGRLAVITFHSLEDRIVKHYFQRESKDCLCPPGVPVCQCGHQASLKIIKPAFIQAGELEIKSNPRSRSARLRVAEKLVLA